MMTETDQDQIVGDMVKERNALRRERTLLNEQIHKTQKGMREATEAATLASHGNFLKCEQGFDYQEAQSFAQSLKRLRDVNFRLDELEKRLDDC